MTLNEILVSALMQLDRGHDAQTLDLWRDKLTLFANDAVREITMAAKPARTEEIETEDGKFSAHDLSRECLRILKVEQNGNDIGFLEELGSKTVLVPTSDRNEPVLVTYRYLPKRLSSPTDEPELPSECHALIITYVVGRERASADVSTQHGANLYFELFREGLKRLTPSLGSPERFRIVNRW